MTDSQITSIEYGMLVGQRPRAAGCNARLAVHGLTVNVPIVRLTTNDGVTGFGSCRTTPEDAQRLLGARLDDLLTVAQGVADHANAFEFPLWDLVGQRSGKPVYQLVAAAAGKTITEPLHVPCYDTSLYIDDLHLDDNAAAAALIAEEAHYGYAHNHRSFKIKVGRGARHMPVEKGTERDIAVIRAVREAVGPEAHIMIDANNGYTLNLTKQVLAATNDCRLFWLEEAFHEDRVLYADLRDWMTLQGLTVLIADGEGQASPSLLDWAKEGVIDVVQYDIFSYGFTNWRKTGTQLDAWQVRSAPHHYGRHLGNYVSGHLAAAIDHFTFVEWDEVATPGLDGSAYVVQDGQVILPNAPGFGLALEEERFRAAVDQTGFRLTV